MKIVVPDFIDIPERDRAVLLKLGEVTIYDDLIHDESVIRDRIQNAELITTGWIHISDRLIRSNPQLKYIVVAAVGYDNIDLQAATAAGIRVCNCPTHNASAVAEYTIALIFAVTRRLLAANADLRRANWNSEGFKGIELAGKKLGLIGYGHIGQQVEKLAAAIGMQVDFVTSRSPAEAIDRLISESDILSLHLPANAQTHQLLDRRRLNLIRPTAYLINTARGAVVDQTALLQLLQEKRIAGAAIDVFADEPVAGIPSAEIQAIARLDNVIATPHMAYNTQEMSVKLGQELLEVMRSCLAKTPINRVN